VYFHLQNLINPIDFDLADQSEAGKIFQGRTEKPHSGG
jgi:hypothetical protein